MGSQIIKTPTGLSKLDQLYLVNQAKNNKITREALAAGASVNLQSQSTDWSLIRNKPESFPPSQHLHDYSNIIDAPKEKIHYLDPQLESDIGGSTATAYVLGSNGEDRVIVLANIFSYIFVSNDTPLKEYLISGSNSDIFVGVVDGISFNGGDSNSSWWPGTSGYARVGGQYGREMKIKGSIRINDEGAPTMFSVSGIDTSGLLRFDGNLDSVDGQRRVYGLNKNEFDFLIGQLPERSITMEPNLRYTRDLEYWSNSPPDWRCLLYPKDFASVGFVQYEFDITTFSDGDTIRIINKYPSTKCAIKLIGCDSLKLGSSEDTFTYLTEAEIHVDMQTSTTIKQYGIFNSGGVRYFNIPDTSQFDYFEIRLFPSRWSAVIYTQNYIDWINGSLSWDKIDKSNSSINDIYNLRAAVFCQNDYIIMADETRDGGRHLIFDTLNNDVTIPFYVDQMRSCDIVGVLNRGIHSLFIDPTYSPTGKINNSRDLIELQSGSYAVFYKTYYDSDERHNAYIFASNQPELIWGSGLKQDRWGFHAIDDTQIFNAEGLLNKTCIQTFSGLTNILLPTNPEDGDSIGFRLSESVILNPGLGKSIAYGGISDDILITPAGILADFKLEYCSDLSTWYVKDHNVLVWLTDASIKADLVDGKVPLAQLPSYVDDVVEYANLASFPAEGEAGKIYVALDSNKTYRWSGTVYINTGAGQDPVFDSLTVDTNTLYVDKDNNRVGIGTIAPDRELTLIGRQQIISSGFTLPVPLNTAVGGLHIIGVGASTAGAMLSAFVTATTNPANFTQTHNKADGSMPGTGYNLGGNAWGALKPSNGGPFAAIGISAWTTENWIEDSNYGGYLRFDTMPNAGGNINRIERMRITENGNITIGALADPANSLTKGLVIGNGTAPSGSVTDAIQLWSANIAGVDGKAGLNLRTEDGAILTFGSNTTFDSASGTTGNILELKVGGVSKLAIDYNGKIPASNISYSPTAPDTSATVQIKLDAINNKLVMSSVDGKASGTLTVDQVTLTTVENVGQTGACDLQLPAAAAGMNFIMICGESNAYAWRIRAGATDKIYLNGTAGADNGYVGISAPTVGSFLSVFTFKTGASTWDWMAIIGNGNWGVI